MGDIADVGHHQHLGQGAQHGGAVFRHHGADEAEHADGRELDYQLHGLHEQVVQVLYQSEFDGSLFLDQQQGKADDEAGHDDLQHVGLNEGLDEIAGEKAHQRVHEADRLRRFVGQVRGLQHGEDALEDVGQDEADGDGQGRGAQVVDHGLQTDGAHLFDVAHGDDAGHDGEKDQRRDHPLDHVQEDGAEGLDVGGGDIGPAHQGQTHGDAQGQGDEDLRRQRELFAFCLCHKDLLSLVGIDAERDARLKNHHINILYHVETARTTAKAKIKPPHGRGFYI